MVKDQVLVHEPQLFSPRGVMSNPTEVPFHSPVSLTKLISASITRQMTRRPGTISVTVWVLRWTSL